MVVGGHELASEMKRRRIGRSTLVDRCDRCGGSTWLPGDPATVPASLLVLAAMSLTGEGLTPLPRVPPARLGRPSAG